MEIKILGSGCKSCHTLEENTTQALKDSGIEATITKVTDFSEIATYGVMSTPALVCNETVLSYGKVLKPDEIKVLIQNL